MTLQGQLELLCSHGFMQTVVHTVPQSVFWALTMQYLRVMVDVGGAGDYSSKVGAKI